jgi:hypothetical protein
MTIVTWTSRKEAQAFARLIGGSVVVYEKKKCKGRKK